MHVRPLTLDKDWAFCFGNAGFTPVQVNRTLKALASKGLITRDRHGIGIPDWKRLRRIADFNERSLHLGTRAGLTPTDRSPPRPE